MLPFYEDKRQLQTGSGRDFHFPLHLHNSLEMIYAISGTVRMEIAGETALLSPGDLAVVFPNQLHAYLGGGEHRMVLCGLQFCGGFVQQLTMHCPRSPVLSAAQLHPNVSYAIEEILREGSNSDAPAAVGALIQLVLARVLPCMELVKADMPENHDLTGRLMRYVSEHFRDPLTLDILARQLHVSKYHLSRVFSGKIGMSFTRYINEFRLDYAASRIRTTGDPLTQIWLEAGFDSQRTFNRVFRQTFGMSPSEYRKM